VKKNEVFLENLGVDIRSQNWTYGLKNHSGRMAQSPDVQFRV
jgi:hypothetical protein